MNSVGDVSDRDFIFRLARTEPSPHRPGHFAVQGGNRVGTPREPEAQHGHAKRLMVVVWSLASQPHQAFLGKAKRFAHRSQMLFDEIPIKAIVTGRDRSMSRENHFPRYARCGGVESDALFLHTHADRFQHRKSAVPFVQVQDARHDAHGFKGAEASDAEHQLLPDSSPRVSAVETRGQLAVVGSIALYIRIEEEKIAASNFHAPDFGMNRTAASFDLHHNRPPVLADGSFQRQLLTSVSRYSSCCQPSRSRRWRK